MSKHKPQPTLFRMPPVNRPGGQDRRGLRRGVALLPSLFTLANLFCGWACVVHAMRGELATAAPFIGVAVVLDMLDGRIARMTKTQSEFGIQLDSLADVVSFGLAPALLVYKWALYPLELVGFFGAFFYAACGAIRLARFNVVATRSRESGHYFTGLPIPLAAAVLIASLTAHLKIFEGSAVKHPHWILCLIVGLGLLMVSTVPYWTFKHYKFNRQTAMLAILFIVAAWLFRLHYPVRWIFSSLPVHSPPNYWRHF